MTPGEIISRNPTIVLNSCAEITQLKIINLGDRPIQIGSHFHFFETNRLLQFARRQAYGKRLNIPSGTAVRFEPGEEKTVELIPYHGGRRIVGFNGLVNGIANQENLTAALHKVHAQQFATTDSEEYKL